MATRRSSQAEQERGGSQVEQYRCGQCSKTVADKDMGIECELCAVWHHAGCVDISVEVYRALSKIKEAHWFCKKCNESAMIMLKTVGKLEERVNRIEERQIKTETEIDVKIQAVTEEMKTIKADIQGQSRELELIKMELKNEVKVELAHKSQDLLVMKQEMQNLAVTIGSVEGEIKEEIHEVKTKSLADIMKEEMEKSLGNMASEIQTVKSNLHETKEEAEEQRDKERRRNNIIIYNIPESSADRADGRTKDDISFCLRMFNNVLQAGVSDEDLAQVFRLGRRDDNATSPRPLLIQLVSYAQKNIIMESLYKLKHAEQQFKSVVVTHDLTKTERDQCKRMVNEAKDKEAQDQSGEYIFRVRGPPGNLRIVRIRRRH